MFDYKKARNNMVDNLIRPANVTNPELLHALKKVQRDKLELSKYCKFCKKHEIHKESK